MCSGTGPTTFKRLPRSRSCSRTAPTTRPRFASITLRPRSGTSSLAFRAHRFSQLRSCSGTGPTTLRPGPAVTTLVLGGLAQPRSKDCLDHYLTMFGIFVAHLLMARDSDHAWDLPRSLSDHAWGLHHPFSCSGTVPIIFIFSHRPHVN